ncbi:MAG: hypothetical protein VYE73_05535 [Acidobacteriota bacterium]|nr:hypothetical protein [Acidobacteriota bacterium]
MWLRLRQIALVATELAPVQDDLESVLGLKVCYIDPGVGRFGLHNALFPVGSQFIEVVVPNDLSESTAGSRYIERRGGDGGYMVITQCDEHAPRRAQVEELGIRIVNQHSGEQYINMQLHPKDTGGSFFEIDSMVNSVDANDPDGPWAPAGPDWKPAVTDRCTAITAATMQCDDPAKVADRWSEIAQIPLDGSTMPLDNAVLKFVPCSDGRPEGLSELDIRADTDAVVAAAEATGCRTGEAQVTICGVRLNLV